jgi:hypothetical protein
MIRRILNWCLRRSKAEENEFEANDKLRVELQMHYDRIATIERLLDIDGKDAAYALADELQLGLFEKRCNEILTPGEKHIKSLFAKRKDCNHLKGGGAHRFRFGWDMFRGKSKDYNVIRHVFADTSEVIRCVSCRKQWRPKNRGWKKAVEMMKQSTNTPSSSEIMLHQAFR